MFEEMSVCSVISLLLFLLVGSIVHGRKENENILEGRHLVIATLAVSNRCILYVILKRIVMNW